MCWTNGGEQVVEIGQSERMHVRVVHRVRVQGLDSSRLSANLADRSLLNALRYSSQMNMHNHKVTNVAPSVLAITSRLQSRRRVPPIRGALILLKVSRRALNCNP